MVNYNHNYLLIVITLLIMVFGQVMSKIGSAQDSFINIFVGMGYVALIIRGLFWIFVLKRFPISFAYPFLSISFVLILVVSYCFFDEPITFYKTLGSLLIIGGVVFTSIGELTKERE